MKEAIYTKSAPEAVGPYSQAVRAGDFIFVSGMLPLDPESGLPVPGSSAEQARQVLNNMRGVLQAAGSSLDDVVKTTIYLSEMESFSSVNEQYASFFKAPYPARATVGVGRLPRGVLVEMDAVAFTGGTK
jgi:2-iminobutanoate/2-iminopropanoate deaminase